MYFRIEHCFSNCGRPIRQSILWVMTSIKKKRIEWCMSEYLTGTKGSNSLFLYTYKLVLAHHNKCVFNGGSSTKEVQKPWYRRSNFPHVRVESNPTTSFYARFLPPEYIKKHNSFF